MTIHHKSNRLMQEWSMGMLVLLHVSSLSARVQTLTLLKTDVDPEFAVNLAL